MRDAWHVCHAGSVASLTAPPQASARAVGLRVRVSTPNGLNLGRLDFSSVEAAASCNPGRAQAAAFASRAAPGAGQVRCGRRTVL
eukprot:7319098-Prymnesium_polylepis.1